MSYDFNQGFEAGLRSCQRQMEAKLAAAEAALKSKWSLDVDSPLFDGLVWFGTDDAVIDAAKLLNTICAVKKERDEALLRINQLETECGHLQADKAELRGLLWEAVDDIQQRAMPDKDWLKRAQAALE